MSFGSRLMNRRNELGITQKQLAKMLGVSQGAIGNYEAGANSPKAIILYKVFEVLKCDANYLFQDEMNELLYKDKATLEEMEGLKKYRKLDSHGQKIIQILLENELNRLEREQENKNTFEQSHQIS